MINLHFEQNLPFVEMDLIHLEKKLYVDKVLIDTGSTETVISADVAVQLDLNPIPSDRIKRIRGIGGVEFVYVKQIDMILLDTIKVQNFKLQVGALDYGFGINAILSMDFLKMIGAVIDIEKSLLYHRRS